MSQFELDRGMMNAAHDLLSEEVIRFGGQLEWLTDPKLIPETSVDTLERYRSPYIALSAWMLTEIAEWSDRVHSKLSWADICDKQELPGEKRVALRTSIKEQIVNMYAPGIVAMAEIHEVVPKLAIREGVADPERWAATANKARKFGRSIARDGTVTQAFVRTYLGGQSTNGTSMFNPAYLRLDDISGITTIEPIAEIVQDTLETNQEILHDPYTENPCLAFAIPIDGNNGASFYDTMWSTYNAAAAKFIFPQIQVDLEDYYPPSRGNIKFNAWIAEIMSREAKNRGIVRTHEALAQKSFVE